MKSSIKCSALLTLYIGVTGNYINVCLGSRSVCPINKIITNTIISIIIRYQIIENGSHSCIQSASNPYTVLGQIQKLHTSDFLALCLQILILILINRSEIAIVRKAKSFYGCTALFQIFGHFFCLAAIIYAFVFSGNTFRAEILYVSFNALHVIRKTFFTFVLRSFQTSGELFASMDRLMVRSEMVNKFL